VDRETGSRALAGVLKQYQRQEYLEAEIKLESQQYTAENNKNNFHFSANRGPVVKVLVEGASMDRKRIKKVIPIFEEGAVDDDLLNEGNRRLRDYYQRLGYFDVKVDHERENSPANHDSGQVTILYKVHLGQRRRVERVTVAGNHYFESATLLDLLSVHAADSLDRHGSYSQTLVAADIAALQAVYRNNGFSAVKITSATPARPARSLRSASSTVSKRAASSGWVQCASMAFCTLIRPSSPPCSAPPQGSCFRPRT
jgi:outer membrane protein assembly factor BamA